MSADVEHAQRAEEGEAQHHEQQQHQQTHQSASIPRSGSGLPDDVSKRSEEREGGGDGVTRALRPLVTFWLRSVLQTSAIPLSDGSDTDDGLWNELRYGILLCNVVNALSPAPATKLVRHIVTEKSIVAAVENLNAFTKALTTYGLEKRYTIRPMDFINATPAGDRAMVRTLAALAVLASEKGFQVADGREDQMAAILQNKGASGEADEGAGGAEEGAERMLDAVLRKVEVLEVEGTKALSGMNAVQAKLKHTIKGLCDPAHRTQDLTTDDARAVLTQVSTLTDEVLATISQLAENVDRLEASQQNILSKIGDLSLVRSTESIVPKTVLVASENDASAPVAASEERNTANNRLSVPPAHISKPIDGRSTSSFFTDYPTDDTHQGHSQTPSMSGDLPGLANLSSTNGGAPFPPAGQAAATAPAAAGPKPMFSKLPPEVQNANLPKQEMMRLSAVYELIETEADYVRDLSLMINFHKTQLQETLQEEDIQTLFSNTDQLVPVNQQLLSRLIEKRDADPLIPEVGDALVDVSESFKIYTTYCGNYPEAMKLVHKLQADPDKKEQLNKMMNSTEGRGLSLESFLIKPVQRICKYPLLIRELQKHTDKMNKDTIALKLAMTKIESVVAHVNEYTRQLGERDRLINLQSKIDSPIPLALQEKKHVRDGLLSRVSNGKARERYVLLFTDVLLICAPQKGGRYTLEAVYDMADLSIPNEAKDPQPKGLKNGFQIASASEGKAMTFSVLSEADRVKWLEAFQSAIKTAGEDAKKSDNMSKRLSVAFTQQFQAFQEEVGGTSARPVSWAMSMGKKGTLTKSGSSMGMSGTLRGTIKGWSNLKRKESDIISTIGSQGSFSEMEAEQEVFEPEMVEISGQIWKRAQSAMGTSYYYAPETKETMWRLPDTFAVLDPDTGKPYPEPEADGEEEDDEGEDEAARGDTVVEPVDGWPDWRKADRGDDMVYYFNVATHETSWTLPDATPIASH
ncbi:uncharacterized protein EV422DRAFT_517301 [Fimicolochytrium jonesii]|uniref:uncharacterized protein n=1 Tax=Fimicolochytrium jonesii TaxID=1396493 RepID=UPI0022FF3CF8|nr:uncharacterized protein EV422DRAFT_517301 [Fimicolochytrium jonesii]KAI8825064.1 hypothetical protein EV422DRAFT_517301 [Fimicolochytrium jonesii]